MKDIPLEERIIFALDFPSVEEAKVWVNKLKPCIKFYKVGLQLFLAGGFEIVDWIINNGLKVMLDLKFFDIPNTVASAVQQIKGRGISYITVHGNDSILKAAVDAKEDIKILAVTVLTSLDRGDLKDLGFERDVTSLVASRAKRAMELGCDGIVCSGVELPLVREKFGDKLIVVVPGVRPVDNVKDDQKRKIDIFQAFKKGADHVVMGRPIKNAIDPLQTVERFQQDIVSALA